MEIKIYKGDPWYADETDDCVRIFRGNLQIIKAPKKDTPYEEYWPEPKMLEWMLDALNKAEEIHHPKPLLDSAELPCWCYNCLKDVPGPMGFPIIATRFIVCPTCGNKRCPKATDHNLSCTGSNEPGQAGSRYE